MSPHEQSAILFTTALLSACSGLSHQDRNRVISCACSFDIQNEREALEGVFNSFHGAGLAPPADRFFASAGPKASAQAERWIQQGITVIINREGNDSATESAPLPRVLFAKGDLSLLTEPIAAVLNSRKTRTSAPGDSWLAATKGLVRFAIGQGFTLASSYGNTAYSVTTVLAAGFPTVIVCPDVLPFMAEEGCLAEFISRWGDLFDWSCTLFVSPLSPGRKPGIAVRSVLRDQVVAGLASVVLVADIRADGNMAHIVEAARTRGTRIGSFPTAGPNWCRLADFVVRDSGSISHGEESWRTEKDLPNLTNALRPLPFQDGQGASMADFLFHYTRSCPGPWPGQTMAQYCRSLIENHEGAAHSALDTLMNILGEKVIRASSRLTRGSFPVVSFTECDPTSLQTLIKWRRGLIRWSFEPYGIGIRKAALLNWGVGQVVYGDESVYSELGEDSRHLFQLSRPEMSDWSAEREWRAKGDLPLNCFENNDVILVIPTCREAQTVACTFRNYSILCLEVITGADLNAVTA